VERCSAFDYVITVLPAPILFAKWCLVAPNDTQHQMQAPSSTRVESGYLTRAEAVAHTRLSQRFLDTLTKNGTLPHFRIGKSIRYIPSEIDQALRDRFHVRAKVRRADQGTSVIA
jgi:predicted DNA-binding transcriptional regulator AlpA